MSFLRVTIVFATFVGLLGCKKTEPRVVVDCDKYQVQRLQQLDTTAAQQAFIRAEIRRELRYKEAVQPGYLLKTTRDIVKQSKIERGEVCYEQLYIIGRLLFEHEYGFADGLGRDDAKTRIDPFRRVHQHTLGGPETNSCTSCHWRGGNAGSGALQDNSFIQGDGTNTSSAEARNPPALLGSGVAQALAQEMSTELQALRDKAIMDARQQGQAASVELQSKGVFFGQIRVSATGDIDTSELEGIDSDLIIRPFGWRGEFATLRDFAMVSAQVHLGIESADLLASNQARSTPRPIGEGPSDDPDDDGMTNELSAGQLTALVLYLASLEVPVMMPPEESQVSTVVSGALNENTNKNFAERFAEGENLFREIGCAICHTPMLVLGDSTFRTTSATSGNTYEFDLSQFAEQPRIEYNDGLNGYPVWLFSDMKRHDLGHRARPRVGSKKKTSNMYLTRRLWGLASSPPYFYDGRSPTIDGAIDSHGGEADFAREEFEELSDRQRGSLRLFLLSLGRSRRLIIP